VLCGKLAKTIEESVFGSAVGFGRGHDLSLRYERFAVISGVVSPALEGKSTNGVKCLQFFSALAIAA
jgi:hypothetical protein